MHTHALGISAPCKEELLDWAYPVHVISPEAVVERKGGAFNNFRGHVNNAFRKNIRAEIIDVVKHGDDIRETVRRWATSSRKEGFTYQDLVSPTETCLQLMEEKRLPLQGIITYADGKPVGFWIWDESDQKKGMATSMVRVAMPPRGSAEFGALKACEVLHSRGFSEFCQGGSETASLDAFKRKMSPVRSIELNSALQVA